MLSYNTVTDGGMGPHGPFGDLVPANDTSKLVAARNSNDLAVPPGGYHGGQNVGISPQAVYASVGTPPVQQPLPTGGATTPPAGGTTPPGSALSAWDTFYNSPTYQVPLKKGLEAVNTGYAAKGALESGAAMKAISDYGAGNASAALGTYMDNLYRQEALGMSASSALAGVGQNMVGQVTSNNNAAASAAGNAALVAGQASANNWNNVGSAVGTAAGTIAGALGSSYHPTAGGTGMITSSGGGSVNTGYLGFDGFH